MFAAIVRLFLFVVFFVFVARAQDLSEPGRFAAGFRSVTITRANNTTLTARLYYPATVAGQNANFDASAAPAPAITFGHGFFQAVTNYDSTLRHLATHGFVVIAPDSESGLFPSHQNFANDLRECLTYFEQQNSSPSSFLFGKINTAKFGASGHSMGGGASVLAAAADARIKALANLAAAETNPSATAAMANVNVPFSLISGSEDSIVPVSSNGQAMYNAGGAPKILPVIQGGFHCGFMDVSVFGCDSGNLARATQLSFTRRLLTEFFTLYLKNDDGLTRQVWAAASNSQIQFERDSGIGLNPAAQTCAAPIGVTVVCTINLTNRGRQSASFVLSVEARRWLVGVSPQITPVLQPNESKTISLSLRRLWKVPPIAANLIISARRANDALTAQFAVVNLR
jgi:predicted dienelactone hydrolase